MSSTVYALMHCISLVSAAPLGCEVATPMDSLCVRRLRGLSDQSDPECARLVFLAGTWSGAGLTTSTKRSACGQLPPEALVCMYYALKPSGC